MADMLMPLQIQRQYASSLDADYEFATLEELKEYATTSALSYSGQVLYCKANDTLYKVNAAKTAVEAIGEGGGGGTNTYTTLAELGLTADATFQDVVDTLPEGGSALLGVKEFKNYQTIFPYEEGNDQFARVHIVKGVADGSSMYARWFRKDGVKEAIANFNINDNLFEGWRILKDSRIYTSLTELGLDTTATINDIIGAMKDGSQFTYKTDVFDYATEYNNIQYGTVTIHKQSAGRVTVLMTDKNTGNLYVGRMDTSNRIVGWGNESFHRIVTQATAGYFKFKPTNNGGFDQALRISVTDNYGGMINISGAKSSASQYKPFKCIRLSYGEYSNYDAMKLANNKMLKLFYYDGYFYLKVTTYTTCTFTGLVEAPTYIETFDETDAEEIPIRSVFDTPYNDGYADPSIIAIGDTASADGIIKTLDSLGFTGDIMTWDTGVYRLSHVAGLTNLPVEITEEKPGLRVEHYDMKKWGNNHNPYASTYGCRQSVLHYKGNVFVRYTESGATAGVLITDTGWRKINTNNSTTLVANTSTLKLDVTKKNSSWYGAIKLTYLYEQSPVELEICFRSATDAPVWTINSGQKYVKSVTYTQDSSNTAHYTIGIEFSGTTYGCYQAEVIGGFADINSLTKDAFTGANVSPYGTPYGKNNGVTLVSAPEDIGLTFPCTSVQLAQAMRNKFNKTITSGAIGVFNNGGSTITDAPSDYGLLHIETFGHDRIMIRYDGIGSSAYAGSWIGQIKGSNGTFSGITWAKIGTDNSIPGRYVADISGSAITIKMTRHDPVKQGIMKIQYNKWITTATYDTRTIELSINPNFPRYTGSHPDEITSVTYNWSGSTATDCSICISVSGSFNPYVIVDMDPTYATINSVTNASTALAYTANPMQASSSTSKTFSNSDVLAADTEIILQPGSGTSLSSSGYEIKNGICYFVVNIQTSSGGTYKPSTTYKVVQLPVPLRYPVAADINGRIYTEISDNKAWVEGDGILRVVMTHTAATYHNLYVSGSYPVK